MSCHEMLTWLEALGAVYKRDIFYQRWWWEIWDAMKREVVLGLIQD